MATNSSHIAATILVYKILISLLVPFTIKKHVQSTIMK